MRRTAMALEHTRHRQHCHKPATASVQTLARSMASSSSAVEVQSAAAAAPPSMAWGTSPSLYLSYGVASLQGKRPSLSDAVAAVPSFSALSPPMGLDYFAVFDGYCGTAVAKYLQERLCEAVAEEVQDELLTWNPRFHRSDNNAADWWKVTMEVAFRSVDERLVGGNVVGEDDLIDVGATALVALVHENYVVLANCGFSKAVMSRGGEAVLLTPEHEEFMADLQEWAEKHGVCMARAKLEKAADTRRMFGTSMCKEEEMVPPEVITVERDPEDEYLILASDGLWESMTPASACAFVRLKRLATAPPEMDVRGSTTLLAKALAEEAISKGSQDNVSVVIILFRDFWRQ